MMCVLKMLPRSVTQTASLMLHCKSTSFKQEVFSNTSLGTMVIQISELCMAGHFKTRHFINVFYNTNKIHSNEPQLYLGQWKRKCRFSSTHLATISPLCAFLPLQRVVTCVTPCPFAFPVCYWYWQSKGVTVQAAYGSKIGGRWKCAVCVAWSRGRRGIQCRQYGQQRGRCSVSASMREQSRM